jgi:hypothetical protein
VISLAYSVIPYYSIRLDYLHFKIFMSRRGPQPERFNRFVKLRDGSGFTIPGSSHVFKFDRYGGWFDEYANYYDQDGNPEDPPSDDPRSDDDHSLSRSDDGEDEY